VAPIVYVDTPEQAVEQALVLAQTTRQPGKGPVN
jgi:hypothetical protein